MTIKEDNTMARNRPTAIEKKGMKCKESASQIFVHWKHVDITL